MNLFSAVLYSFSFCLSGHVKNRRDRSKIIISLVYVVGIVWRLGFILSTETWSFSSFNLMIPQSGRVSIYITAKIITKWDEVNYYFSKNKMSSFIWDLPAFLQTSFWFSFKHRFFKLLPFFVVLRKHMKFLVFFSPIEILK